MKKMTMTNEIFAQNLRLAIAYNQEHYPKRMNSLLDLRLVDCDVERKWASFSFVPDEWALNPSGSVHGGVIATLFDYAGGLITIVFSRHFMATTSLSTTYLRPMNRNRFRVEVELSHLGSRVCNALGRIYDDETGKLCATSEVTFFVKDVEAVGLQN